MGFFLSVCFCFVFLPLFDLSISNEGTSELRVHMSYLWKSLVETLVADGNLGLCRPVK